MKLSGYVDDAIARWLPSAAANCCMREPSPIRGLEEPRTALHDAQPQSVSAPVFAPQQRSSSRGRDERPVTRGQEWVERSRSFASRASSRGSFSVKRRLNAYNGPRKTSSRRTRVADIGPPSDFRRVEDAMPRMANQFRPLELSIYMPQNQLSPILPHFGDIDHSSSIDDLSPSYPPPAFTHSRSSSFMSFSVPRNPSETFSGNLANFSSPLRGSPYLGEDQSFQVADKEFPRPPPMARVRASTGSHAHERLKSAVYEKIELEQKLRDIEAVIDERQSVYINSRPTSRMSKSPSVAGSLYIGAAEGLPLPSVPRLQSPLSTRIATQPLSQRPKTAPGKTVHIPRRGTSFTEASAAFKKPPQPFTPLTPAPKRLDRTIPPPQFVLPPRNMERVIPPRSFSSPNLAEDFIPPPPLPLVLQSSHPPLRKKKSFSRVSNWLFPDPKDTENVPTISMGSLTNTPKPITSRDGFYQCVDTLQRTKSVSTISTLESYAEERTVPTTWTPDSSPGQIEKMDFGIAEVVQQDASVDPVRTRTFGERAGSEWMVSRGKESVGIAF